MAQYILTEKIGRVGLLTFNRPDMLNALNGEMHYEIRDQIREWNSDADIGAIVLTGAGRAFCSGADISSFEASAEGRTNAGRPRPSDNEWVELTRASKPIICAINGAAVGEGLTMALHCDLRVASENARLSFRFIRLGLTPELASTHYLPQLVGLGTAMELLLTGRFVDGAEAATIGLVNHVHPAETMLDETIKLAQAIADNPEPQVGQVKRMVYENYVEKDLCWVIHRENERFSEAMASDAHREALAAFRERRDPEFHSRP